MLCWNLGGHRQARPWRPGRSSPRGGCPGGRAARTHSPSEIVPRRRRPGRAGLPSWCRAGRAGFPVSSRARDPGGSFSRHHRRPGLEGRTQTRRECLGPASRAERGLKRRPNARIPARGPAPSREPRVTGEAASGRVRGADGMRAAERPGRSRRGAAARGPNPSRMQGVRPAALPPPPASLSCCLVTWTYRSRDAFCSCYYSYVVFSKTKTSGNGCSENRTEFKFWPSWKGGCLCPCLRSPSSRGEDAVPGGFRADAPLF